MSDKESVGSSGQLYSMNTKIVVIWGKSVIICQIIAITKQYDHGLLSFLLLSVIKFTFITFLAPVAFIVGGFLSQNLENSGCSQHFR